MTANPVRGVTNENYASLGKAFIASNGNAGHIVGVRPHIGFKPEPDEPFRPTPRQWGAWLSYWQRVDVKHRGKLGRGWATVPTEWPHEFDATATVQGDFAAGDVFEAKWRREREDASWHAKTAVRDTSKAMAMWRQTRGEIRPETPQAHLTAPSERRQPTSEELIISRDRIAAWEQEQQR